MSKDRLWVWRAWTAKRERIADCGTCWATDADGARHVGWQCLGGPHAKGVLEMQVEEIDLTRQRGHRAAGAN